MVDAATEAPRTRNASAPLAVGFGHLLGWFLAFSVWATKDRQLGLTGESTPPAEIANALAAVFLLIGGVLFGCVAAARLSGHKRPVLRGLLGLGGLVVGAVVALVLALGVAGIVDVGDWQPPMLGAGIGVQLTIVLSRAGAGRSAARIVIPMLVDTAAWLTVGLVAPNGWSLAWAVSWFLAGLAGVVALEATAAGPSWLARGLAQRQTG